MSVNHPSIPLLQEQFGEQHCQALEFAGMVTTVVPKAILLEVMGFLHVDPRCGYEQLVDIFGADYLGYPREEARFALVYPLLNLKENRRLAIKVYCDEKDMVVPSLVSIFRGAEWPEREAAEMFGFVFTDHPDPRRLLLADLYEGKYPLRKDYPLRGEGERESFTPITRETA